MSSARISRSRSVFSLRKIIAGKLSGQIPEMWTGRPTGCDVVCGIAERANTAQLVLRENALGVKLDSKVEECVRKLRGIRRRVGFEEFLSAHAACGDLRCK